MKCPGRLSLKNCCKGSSVVDVVIWAAIIVFVIMPVFAAVIEKFILLNKIQVIKDAVDITNISTYNSIVAEYLGKTIVEFDRDKVYNIYRELLSENLNLNWDLSPRDGSIAKGNVRIESIVLYTSQFPAVCPEGLEIKRPAVHSVVTVPIKPALFSEMILNMLGKQNIELKIHVDSDIPLDK
ncbi:MAG TPA: hypothetical protein GXX14_10965 [Clostridiaceae bacterium]|nr:hypothetical protein [Clostridiaceae bacterium]